MIRAVERRRAMRMGRGIVAWQCAGRSHNVASFPGPRKPSTNFRIERARLYYASRSHAFPRSALKARVVGAIRLLTIIGLGILQYMIYSFSAQQTCDAYERFAYPAQHPRTRAQIYYYIFQLYIICTYELKESAYISICMYSV